MCLGDVTVLYPSKKPLRGKQMDKVLSPKEEVSQGLSSSAESIGFIEKPIYFLQVKNTLGSLKF